MGSMRIDVRVSKTLERQPTAVPLEHEMSAEVVMELEGEDPDWSACVLAASMSGAVDINEGGVRLGGRYPNSWMFFCAYRRERLSGIFAEGRHDCSFPVLYEINFRLNIARYVECVHDIKTFAENLSKLSPMQWVLSFQYEQVYATNDRARGFQFFWWTPR